MRAPTAVFLGLVLTAAVVAALIVLLVLLVRSERVRRYAGWTLLALVPLALIALLLVPAVRVHHAERARDLRRTEEVARAALHREVAEHRRETPGSGDVATVPGEEPQGERSPSSLEEDLRIGRRPGAPLVAAPDEDFSQWERDGGLPFRSADGRDLVSDSGEGAVREEGGPPTWVDDAAGARLRARPVGATDFVYWEPGARGKLAGYSSIEATREEAFRAAWENATQKLAVLSVLRLKEENPGLDARLALPLARREVTGGWPRRERRVGWDVARDGRWKPPPAWADGRYPGLEDLHLERARSRFSGADVYRAAVLVDASEGRIRTLGAEIAGELRRGWIESQERRRRLLGTVAFGALAIFAVFAVYSLLNAGTRGHFAWPLRIVAGCVILVLLSVAIYYVRVRLAIG